MKTVILILALTPLAGIADTVHFFTEQSVKHALGLVQTRALGHKLAIYNAKPPAQYTSEKYSPDFVFTAPANIEGGIAIIQAIEQRREQSKQRCSQPQCTKIIESNAINIGEDLISGLLECTVITIAQQEGAPFQCQVIALIKNADIYVKAISGWSLSSAFGSIPKFDIQIYSKGNPDKTAIHRTIKSYLSQEPLHLTTAAEQLLFPVPQLENQILGVYDRKYLTFLRKRVRASVRIDSYTPVKSTTYQLEGTGEFALTSNLIVSADIMVNDYNTDDNKDWHLPSQSLLNRYVTELKQIVSDAIREHCQFSYWVDARQLLCTSKT